MKTRTLVALGLAFGLLIANVSLVLAVPPLPSSFHGTVKVGGENVPEGTIIFAWINGVKYKETTVQLWEGNTVYAISVPGDDLSTSEVEGGREGDVVEFYIGGQRAERTGVWHSGTSLPLDLGISKITFFVYLPMVLRNFK